MTPSVIAMETLLASVSFCQKPGIIFNPLQQDRAWNRHGNHIVLTLIIRLALVNGPWVRQKLGISVLITIGRSVVMTT